MIVLIVLTVLTFRLSLFVYFVTFFLFAKFHFLFFVDKKNFVATSSKGNEQAVVSTPKQPEKGGKVEKTQLQNVAKDSGHEKIAQQPENQNPETKMEFTPIQKKIQKTPAQKTPKPKQSTPKQEGAVTTFKNVKQMTAARRKDIESKISEAAKSGKKAINLVVIGHVDSGKSTLMGQLLYQLGYIDNKIIHK